VAESDGDRVAFNGWTGRASDCFGYVSEVLGPLAAPKTTGTTTENTPKALDPLAAAEQDILGARCRSRLG
jgi:hypothetical protein